MNDNNINDLKKETLEMIMEMYDKAKLSDFSLAITSKNIGLGNQRIKIEREASISETCFGIAMLLGDLVEDLNKDSSFPKKYEEEINKKIKSNPKLDFEMVKKTSMFASLTDMINQMYFGMIKDDCVKNFRNLSEDEKRNVTSDLHNLNNGKSDKTFTDILNKLNGVDKK